MDKLFPYAEANVKQFLENQWESENVIEAVKALRKLALEDHENSVDGVVAISGEDASKEDQIESLVNNVKWQMSSDRKVGALKQLQGLIWKQGYDNGDIKGHVFDDVSAALEQWHSPEEQKVYIYSSGSVQAQKLLFGQSLVGDLLSFIDGHFDTAVGAKQEADSYKAIVEKIGCKSDDILFLTDIEKEAEAARAAGLNVALVSREGNAPLSAEATASFVVINSLAELTISNKRKTDPQESDQPAKIPKTDLSENVMTCVEATVAATGAAKDIEISTKVSDEMEVEETIEKEVTDDKPVTKETELGTKEKKDTNQGNALTSIPVVNKETKDKTETEKETEPMEVDNKNKDKGEGDRDSKTNAEPIKNIESERKLKESVEKVEPERKPNDTTEKVESEIQSKELPAKIDNKINATESMENGTAEIHSIKKTENIECETKSKEYSETVESEIKLKESVEVKTEINSTEPEKIGSEIKSKEIEVLKEQETKSLEVPKDRSETNNIEEQVSVQETTSTIITEIEDVTHDTEAIAGVEIMDDIEPIVEEPVPTEEMEQLQNVGEVLDKECDEILSKVQDVTNLENINLKTILVPIIEEPMETDSVESNEIIDRILNTELEFKPKYAEENVETALSEQSSVTNDVSTTETNSIPAEKEIESREKEKVVTEENDSNSKLISDTQTLELNQKSEQPTLEAEVTTVAVTNSEDCTKEITPKIPGDEQVNGTAATNGDELSSRLSVENGKEIVNGSNGDSSEVKNGSGDNKVEAEITEIKVKTVTTDEPRTDLIEQLTEA